MMFMTNLKNSVSIKNDVYSFHSPIWILSSLSEFQVLFHICVFLNNSKMFSRWSQEKLLSFFPIHIFSFIKPYMFKYSKNIVLETILYSFSFSDHSIIFKMFFPFFFRFFLREKWKFFRWIGVEKSKEKFQEKIEKNIFWYIFFTFMMLNFFLISLIIPKIYSNLSHIFKL